MAPACTKSTPAAAKPSHLKVIYFDLAGRAEPIRLALKLANIPFEDQRLSREQWLELKPSMPFHQLPVLEVDHKTLIPQSDAIMDYVCRIGGLLPEDPLMDAHGNAVCGAMEDLVTNVVGPWIHAAADKKEEVAAKAIDEHLKGLLTAVDGFIAKHQKNGYIVENKLTKADILVFAWINGMKAAGFPMDVRAHVNERHPHIKATVDLVESLPAVKAHYGK